MFIIVSIHEISHYNKFTYGIWFYAYLIIHIERQILKLSITELDQFINVYVSINFIQTQELNKQNFSELKVAECVTDQ